ncbi:uncharacterized protein LOC123538725 [Mercenaria mercenaria]|uniref:uncharacterized protein LOC123538725 n=1 Tax=Mercenaria mercenaria TaxID=6596 RepID=UPI00234E9D2F|nr:uncharacterized protein LOC123538725 [Mercenaria mercenaria]
MSTVQEIEDFMHNVVFFLGMYSKKRTKCVSIILHLLGAAITILRFFTGVFSITSGCNILYTTGVYLLIRSCNSIIFWFVCIFVRICHEKPEDMKDLSTRLLFQLPVIISMLISVVVFIMNCVFVFQHFNVMSDLCPSRTTLVTVAKATAMLDTGFFVIYVALTIAFSFIENTRQ